MLEWCSPHIVHKRVSMLPLYQFLLVAPVLSGWEVLPVQDAEPEAVNDQQALIERREADFADLLTGARLVGFFTQSDKPDEAPKEDSYTLTRVSKAEEDRWLFEASIEFGASHVPIRLKLPVLWAGDSPVISVTDMSFPMLGSYTARVLFHGDEYIGIWSGKDHGGKMWGRVVRQEEKTESCMNWPSFRGPQASGICDGLELPTEWDLEEGTNVRWRRPFPGLAHSSPVIWGDRMFITTAVRKDGDQELKVGLYGDIKPIEDESIFSFELHCLDKRTGETLWSQTCWEGVPAVQRHPKGSHAAASPTVDADRVVAFFGGEGIYCYDHLGNALWQRDLGPMDSGFYMMPDAQWGFGASPVLSEGRVILQCDNQENSFVAALDGRTGEDLWRTARADVPTWSTPTVHITEDRSQVICNGFKHPAGYDLETGQELWSLSGGGDIPVPTPIVSGDMIFITNAHGMLAPIFALDVNVTGELSIKPDEEPFMIWGKARRGNYMQTPLAYGDEVYFCNDAGIVTCYEAASGQELYRERLGVGRTGFTSSPVAANGNLYYASEEGDVHVVRMGAFEVLAINSLGEECMATPAISEGALYYRTRGHVLSIGFLP